jgi:hypothetical protein
VTAPMDKAWQAVEMFEEWTGLTVQSDRRPRRRVLPPPGQETLPMPELESPPSEESGDSAPTGEQSLLKVGGPSHLTGDFPDAHLEERHG